MKKYKKIIVLILLAMTFLITFSLKIYASGSKIEIDDFGQTHGIDVTPAKDFAGTVLGYIRNISVIATVLIIAYFGIAIMIGSADDRAEYKKRFMPLIIGVAIVASSTTIMDIVWKGGQNGEGETACKHVWSCKDAKEHACEKCGTTEEHHFVIKTGPASKQCPECYAVQHTGGQVDMPK